MAHEPPQKLSPYPEATHGVTPGSIVCCRNRDWVLLPSNSPDVHLLRPLTGATDDIVALHRQLTDLIGYDLPEERICSATFPLPSPDDLADAASAHLLWQAARLTLREGATPFRSLGRISIRPRIYQFVPLLMALRLDPVRLLIADDVGVGKTIEALLIARELYDRGEIRRLCVLCPPYLCEQWQKELADKFHLDAVVIRSGTINHLERRKAGTESIYRYYPVQVASIDFLKSDRNKHLFLLNCPDLVIVDEAHGSASASECNQSQHQRHELVRAIAAMEDRPSIQYILALWAAGFYLHRGDTKQAVKLLHATVSFNLDRAVERALGAGTDEQHAKRLAQGFPLTGEDVRAIAECLHAPESLARDLVERFSPKWFLGWRDICRSTDERTTISSALPQFAVGDTFLLIFSQSVKAPTKLGLIANLNSFIQDYGARQKVGGTHMKYNVFRQLAVLPPSVHGMFPSWDTTMPLVNWIVPRVLELVYTAHDLAPLARDCGYDGPPFPWDDARSFEIRCELDAAFFHLYMPCKPDGSWRKAESETPEQLTALKHHFPQPRDAVAYILEQFPIVRQKDERAYGNYRTKERILESLRHHVRRPA